MQPNEQKGKRHHRDGGKAPGTTDQVTPVQSEEVHQNQVAATPPGHVDRAPRRGKKLTNWLTSSGRAKGTDLQLRELVFDLHAGQSLTPIFLTTKLLPYLLAIDELQRTVELLTTKPLRGLVIHSIVENMVAVSFEGGNEIIHWIVDRFEHWRIRYGDRISALEEEKLRIEIEAATIGLEVPGLSKLNGVSRALVDDFIPGGEFDALGAPREASKLDQADQIGDSASQWEILRQAQLATRKELMELEKLKFQLAVDLVNEVCPDLAELDRLPVVSQVKRQIDLMLDTRLKLKQGA